MKELETVSANTLIATPFEPLKMLVQNLIGEGITIIGGGSKCGKSWLMLKLCLAVADGAPFFDMETEQADVLYLCLEDSFRRLQERLFKLTDNDAPENLHMAVSAGVIGNELEDQIRDFKDKHPNLRLIVVDTLQMVREQDPYLNAYADDYKCLTRLKALAESIGLSIVLVHHLRKLGSSDPFEMLTGSTGLQGASDTLMVLKRERGTNTGILYVTGRDMEQQKLTMRFDKGRWALQERADAIQIQEERIPPFIHRVLKWMPPEHWQGTATELIEAMSETEIVPTAVTKLLNQHHVFLQENGIEYAYHRTRDERLITLTRIISEPEVVNMDV
ncbi:MAG: AAA family ATPase [Clostridia bacterium]|nr:AAA family ATPase [Clostridia bacterium]MBR6039379.1 AAA family ATPase [Clostridia bacterium]